MLKNTFFHILKGLLFLVLLFITEKAFPIDKEQRISVNIRNASLEEILQEINSQTGIYFSYDSKIAKEQEWVNISMNNEKVGVVLEYVCKSFDLEYSVIRGQVVFRKIEPAQKKEKDTKKQKRHTLSGHIRSKESGETLPGATVMIEGANKGTITNAYGFYSITLPENSYKIIYSFVGYERIEVEVNLNKEKQLNAKLELRSLSLDEITIDIDNQLENLRRSQSGKISVNPRNIAKIPEFAGGNGVIRNLQSFPGIQTHSDGSAFFYVRGGNKDQNLILIDEAPVYNPAHLFGFYSVIIPEVAKEINIYKADMPIDKSSRVSSLVEVHTKDGSMKKHGVEGVLNPLMYRFSLEGPIVRDKVSFYTSYRRSNFDWLYKQTAPNSDLYMSDFNTKLNWQINNENRIYLACFFGNDNYTSITENNQKFGLKWQNFTSTLRWNKIFNSRLFSNATIYISDYNYNLLTGGDPWQSAISDLGIKYDFSYFSSPDETIRFGFSNTWHQFNPGNIETEDETNPYYYNISAGKATHTTLYVNREKRLSNKWAWTAGVKMPVWINKGPNIVYGFDEDYNVIDTLLFQDGERAKTYINLDWRLSAAYNINDFSALKTSYGNYNQYLHLISNSISPLSSFEIWMPSGHNIKPQQARQLTFGYTWLENNYGLEFNSDVFYKRMFNQIEYSNHANLMLNPLVEGELRFGERQSYGFEVSLEKNQGRVIGWVNYTYSRVFNQFEDINDNNKYPAFYDRPHDFTIFVSWLITQRLSMSFNWVYHTGSAITSPVGFYNYQDKVVPIYGERNNDRLPNYHRLDWAINFQINQPHRRYQHSISFGIYNLYNRENAVSVNFNKVETQEGNFVVPANLYGTHDILTTKKYMMGFMPSLTYKFKL